MEVLKGSEHRDTGAGYLLHLLQFPLANHLFNTVPALSTIGPLEVPVIRTPGLTALFLHFTLVFS